jgi:MoaA/NifB/PqqE/SkfB family radical SAM enzyme
MVTGSTDESRVDTVITPSFLRLDACSRCQLRCTGCGQVSGSFKRVSQPADLNPEDFDALLAANPGIRKIEFGNLGEALLNSKLPDILRSAYTRGVAAQIMTGCNFNTLTEPVLQALVRFDVKRISASIDGASQETYAQYRINGDFNRVIANLKRLKALKQELKSKTPVLRWQFVVFGHNEHELPLARKLAEELDMQFWPKMNVKPAISPINDVEFVKANTSWTVTTRKEYAKQLKKDYMHDVCCLNWVAPQITPQGYVLGCCKNTRNHVGETNVFSSGLDDAINQQEMIDTRAWLSGQTDVAAVPRQCRSCGVAHSRIKYNSWVTAEDIETVKAKFDKRGE